MKTASAVQKRNEKMFKIFDDAKKLKKIAVHERLVETLVQVQRYLESVEQYLPETQDREEIAYGITEALKQADI